MIFVSGWVLLMCSSKLLCCTPVSGTCPHMLFLLIVIVDFVVSLYTFLGKYLRLLYHTIQQKTSTTLTECLKDKEKIYFDVIFFLF